MSLTTIDRQTRACVRVGGEYDSQGERGRITLSVDPPIAQLTSATARRVARALLGFAAHARRPGKRIGKIDESKA
jgi:hypothetical protein